MKPGDKVGLFSSFKTFASVRDLMNKKKIQYIRESVSAEKRFIAKIVLCFEQSRGLICKMKLSFFK